MGDQIDGAIVTRPAAAPLTAEQVVDRVRLIQHVMRDVMKPGTHYDSLPGCGSRKVLLKPGAEVLAVTFRLSVSFRVRREELAGGHREYVVRCVVCGPDGSLVCEGVGSCSTLETKYRYRQAGRSCPKCGREAIIKGKQEYGGGWVCFRNKGGCGAKFTEADPAITSQAVGRVENPDIADSLNTVLKMAKKRAMVDAVISATAASDIFTQDLEDLTAAAEPDQSARRDADAPPPQTAQTPTAAKPSGNGRKAAPVASAPAADAPHPRELLKAARNLAKEIGIEAMLECVHAIGLNEARELAVAAPDKVQAFIDEARKRVPAVN